MSVIVRGHGRNGQIVYLTGKAGDGWVSENPSDAFDYGSIIYADNRAKFHSGYSELHGYEFFPVPIGIFNLKDSENWSIDQIDSFDQLCFDAYMNEVRTHVKYHLGRDLDDFSSCNYHEDFFTQGEPYSSVAPFLWERHIEERQENRGRN